MEQPEMQEFLDFMVSKGVKLHVLHTSGHADSKTIEKIIEKTSIEKEIELIKWKNYKIKR